MLNIYRGTWRIAVVFPTLGVAVKIPRIRIGTIWRHYKKIRSVSELIPRIREEVRFWYLPASTVMCLFGGYVMNLREMWFCLSYRSNNMVLPTYFSLIGLLNIMSAGRTHSITGSQILSAALSVTDWSKLDPHTWSDPKNFVRDRRGSLCLVDYGDPRTQQVISDHGEDFERAFRVL